MQARMKSAFSAGGDAGHLLEQSIEGKLPLKPASLCICAPARSMLQRLRGYASKELQKDGVPLEHIFAVAAWRDTPYFSDAERAALELTENLTRLADQANPVPDAVWEKVARHFSQPEIAALLVSIALINSWNRFNVAVRMTVGEKWEKAA